jgi:hypothetical protein
MASCAAEPAANVEITVTSPWLAVVTQFLGGVNVSVNSIQEWNASGILSQRLRGRALQSLPKDRRLVGFDAAEFLRLGIDPGSYPNLRVLYEQIPFGYEELDRHFTDPSVLPFITSKLLPILSGFDPDNYAYYQRRLAEFQTRLRSTILAGRHLLMGQTVYDLTGNSAYLLISVGCRVKRPSQEELDAWAHWRQTDSFFSTVRQHIRDHVPVVMDATTHKTLLSMAKSEKGILHLPRPGMNEDFLGYVHNLFLAIWSKASEKRPARQR